MNEIKTFLNSGLLKQSSKNMYNSIIKEYFKAINKKNKISQYFQETEQQHRQDIMKYFNYLQNKNSHSIKTKIRVIKSLHDYHEIQLPNIFYKKIIKTQPTRAITRDKIPSKEILKEWLSNSKTKENALILLLATTGLRIEEALNLEPSDINTTDYTEEPYPITVRPETKTGNTRLVFTTQETIDTINRWLKLRPDYIKHKKEKHYKYDTGNKDKKLFPFSYKTALRILKTTLKNTKHNQKDKITNRYEYHYHSIRKYFKNTLANIHNIPSDIPDAILGHEEKLKEIYNRFTPEQLRENYKIAIPYLNIFESQINYKKLDEKQQVFQKTLSEQIKENQLLKDEIALLKNMITNYNNRIKNKKSLTYKDFINDLEKS